MSDRLNVASIPIGELVANRSESFAAGAGATDLTARPGKPNHAAQCVDFYNDADATQNIVCVTWSGATLTVPLGPRAGYTPKEAVASVSASTGANISWTAYWWKVPGSKDNPS
jgi:hypothetical protein